MSRKKKIPRKDPAFLFYPGDYLRDTQCLSEAAQVAYDRIMCEHMRNIRKDMIIICDDIVVSQSMLNFFTKRLESDEKDTLISLLRRTPKGFQIEWVALSIKDRLDYSLSRRENRSGQGKRYDSTYDHTYDSTQGGTQESEDESEDESELAEKKRNKKEISAINPIDPNKMGFLGRVRHWMETEHNYIWTDQDTRAAAGLEAKFKELHRRQGLPTDPQACAEQFRIMVNTLPEWVKVHKFSLEYWDAKFNEIRGTKPAAVNGTGKRKKPEGMRESDWFFMQNLPDEEIEAYGYKMEKA